MEVGGEEGNGVRIWRAASRLGWSRGEVKTMTAKTERLTALSTVMGRLDRLLRAHGLVPFVAFVHHLVGP